MKEKWLDKLLTRSFYSCLMRIAKNRGPGLKDIWYAILIKEVSGGDKDLIESRCKRLFHIAGCKKEYLLYDYDKLLKK